MTARDASDAERELADRVVAALPDLSPASTGRCCTPAST